MLRLTQKIFTNETDGKHLAYVECLIVNGDYDYRVKFDDMTKKRANYWFKSMGFVIGEVVDPALVPEKVVEL